jgi:amidophosphoribosyltransferase
VDETASAIGADSLAYLSHDGLLQCVRSNTPGYCTACFSGEYPIRIPEPLCERAFLDSSEPKWWQQENLGMEAMF